MIYPNRWNEVDHGRWIDIINPIHVEREIAHCISEALKRIEFLEDFKIVFRYSPNGTAGTQVRFERIHERKMD